ncbi:hypothetical protein BDZ89DRAFT_1049730 [Hymenopellis radicata]|nr:hypothetical protein BDZ89DRAFT_1049730 [Hymenopellis radicata]
MTYMLLISRSNHPIENIKIAAQLAVLQEPVLQSEQLKVETLLPPPPSGHRDAKQLSRARDSKRHLECSRQTADSYPNIVLRLSRPPSQRSHRILKKGAVTFAAVLVAERRPPNCQNLGTLGWALPHVLCTVVLMPYISSRAVVKRPTELRPGYRHPRSNKQTNRLTQGIRMCESYSTLQKGLIPNAKHEIAQPGERICGEGLSISAGSTVSSSVVRATFATWSSLSDFDKRSVLFDFPSRSFIGGGYRSLSSQNEAAGENTFDRAPIPSFSGFSMESTGVPIEWICRRGSGIGVWGFYVENTDWFGTECNEEGQSRPT